MADYIEAFVGFDTCKSRNAVAIAEVGRAGEVRFFGEIENSGAATAKLVRKLGAKYQRLTFCYEAGPTGYGLYRQIKSLGHECLVVAPGRATPTIQSKYELPTRTREWTAARPRDLKFRNL